MRERGVGVPIIAGIGIGTAWALYALVHVDYWSFIIVGVVTAIAIRFIRRRDDRNSKTKNRS